MEENKPDKIKQEEKVEKKEEKVVETEEKEVKAQPKEDKLEGKKPKEKKKEVIKKENAIAKGLNLRISAKKAAAMCKFIKGKEIGNAIEYVEKVISKKIPVPIKGEYPHKKGIAGGAYPVKVGKELIKILKSLKANSLVNGLEDAVIIIAKADIASRPYRRGNRRFKRANIFLEAKEKKEKKK